MGSEMLTKADQSRYDGLMTTATDKSIREAIAEQLSQQAALRIVDVRPDELEMMIEAIKDVADEMPIEVAAYSVVEGFLEGDLG